MIDRIRQCLRGSWIFLDGRGMVFVLVVAAVSLFGVGFSFFNLALGIVGGPILNGP